MAHAILVILHSTFVRQYIINQERLIEVCIILDSEEKKQITVVVKWSNTFILEAADNVGSGHGIVVISKAVVQLHHVFRWLLSGASKWQRRWTRASQVECLQKLLFEAFK